MYYITKQGSYPQIAYEEASVYRFYYYYYY
jgi:hypothetical protein